MTCWKNFHSKQNKVNSNNVIEYHQRWINGETLKELATEIGITQNKLSTIFRNYGLPQPRRGGTRKKGTLAARYCKQVLGNDPKRS